jgi:hypothetical protein
VAEKLVDGSDTLLVIDHGRSQKIEDSVRTYFGARPQVPLIATVATDDDLLAPCNSSTIQRPALTDNDSGSSCFDGSWVDALTQGSEPFAPLLQLSPTNQVQGASAVQFALQSGKHRFLIVLGNDPNDQSYTENMKNAYGAAIRAARAQLVGVLRMDALPSSFDFDVLKPDCVLYAGSLGEAQTLFNRLSTIKPGTPEFSMMLSDSVIQSRGTDADLAGFIPASPDPSMLPRFTPSGRHGPIELAGKIERVPVGRSKKALLASQSSVQVNFTFQDDAADYNSHKSPYVDDAFSVALQLINDLNERGGDLSLRVKSLFHIQNVKDVRRNLLRIMKQNSSSRTWYESKSGMPYVFDGPKQFHGIFHVWQLKQGSSLVGSEMDDVDHWHIPRTRANLQDDKGLAAAK